LPGCVQQVLLRADGEFLSSHSVQATVGCGFDFIIANKRCDPPFAPDAWYRAFKRKDIEFNSSVYPNVAKKGSKKGGNHLRIAPKKGGKSKTSVGLCKRGSHGPPSTRLKPWFRKDSNLSITAESYILVLHQRFDPTGAL
jgi:hypothetical protein